MNPYGVGRSEYLAFVRTRTESQNGGMDGYSTATVLSE